VPGAWPAGYESQRREDRGAYRAVPAEIGEIRCSSEEGRIACGSFFDLMSGGLMGDPCVPRSSPYSGAADDGQNVAANVLQRAHKRLSMSAGRSNPDAMLDLHSAYIRTS